MLKTEHNLGLDQVVISGAERGGGGASRAGNQKGREMWKRKGPGQENRKSWCEHHWNLETEVKEKSKCYQENQLGQESKGGMIRSGNYLKTDSVSRQNCHRWKIGDCGQKCISKCKIFAVVKFPVMTRSKARSYLRSWSRRGYRLRNSMVRLLDGADVTLIYLGWP